MCVSGDELLTYPGCVLASGQLTTEVDSSSSVTHGKAS